MDLAQSPPPKQIDKVSSCALSIRAKTDDFIRKWLSWRSAIRPGLSLHPAWLSSFAGRKPDRYLGSARRFWTEHIVGKPSPASDANDATAPTCIRARAILRDHTIGRQYRGRDWPHRISKGRSVRDGVVVVDVGSIAWTIPRMSAATDCWRRRVRKWRRKRARSRPFPVASGR
jgi:hypothetical protein